MFVKGSTVFADISKFVEICKLQLPGTVHAVWNDGGQSSTTASTFDSRGMNSIGAGDSKPINLHEIEQSVKELNDIIEASRRLGLNSEADGTTKTLDEFWRQVRERLDTMKRSLSDSNRQAQEDASSPLVGEDQQQQQPGMDAGGLDMGGGAPMDLAGAGNENGGDFGDFAALSSAQEEGNTSPSGSTAPNPNDQQQQNK